MDPKNRIPSAATIEQFIWTSLDGGKNQQAIDSCRVLNQNYPEYASGWHTTSHVAMRLNNPLVALTAINRAVELEPENIIWLLQQATCLASLQRLPELSELLSNIKNKAITTAYQHSTLGSLLCQVGDHKLALPHYQKAISLKPLEAHQHYNIACVYRSLGMKQEAEDSFDEAIRLKPDDYESYKIRAELRTQTSEANHVAQLQRLFKSGIKNDRGSVQIGYALAKELEDLGEDNHSFAHLKKAADTRRRYMKYDIEAELTTMSEIQKAYPASFFGNKLEGYNNQEALFILGMPRTGSTLVERILSSHSDVYAAGELTNFAVQMAQMTGGQAKTKSELVAATTTMDFEELGRRYIDSTRPFTGDTVHFIDKMPLNFLYAGLIHQALPNAKIIHLTRDPIDTCYSIYKQLFVDAYPFSYQLNELARYYIAYRQLMDHWHKVMPGVIYDVSYEKLVTDIESQSRELISFCGLNWQAACLKFYENDLPSTTASAMQIREPAYQRSVGNWKRFAGQLEPLIGKLEQAGLVDRH